MDTNYIALAIPAFFVLIGVEIAVAWLKGRRVYRFDDAVTDLSCGISSEVSNLFLAGLLLAGYVWCYERFAAFELSASSVWVWAGAFLAVDFLYYGWHRASHEVAFLWAAHVVHHQSEDYNLAVALRQAMFTNLTGWAFYLPLAFLGVPPVVMATARAFNTLYQFWIHTELVGRLGPLEWILNTPSAHRVHHAINPGYLDKNYAGILIIWDRVFGSYAPETEAPVYGITKALGRFDPIWANFHVWVELAQKARAADGIGNKLRAFFARPAWLPASFGPSPGPEPVSRETFEKYRPPPLGRPLTAWVCFNFVGVAAGLVLLMLYAAQLPFATLAAGSGLIVATLWGWSAFMERRAVAWPFEVVRLLGVAAFAVSFVAF